MKMKMKKLLAVMLGTVLSISVLAGCGATPETERAAEQVEADAEAVEANIEEAETSDGKTWIVATDTVFKPFEYTNEQGEFVGIDVDLLAAIAEDQGFEYDLQSIGWDGAVASVQSGQADAIIAGATIKDERVEAGWIFSDGYFDATQTFVVGEGSDIASFADLAGKKVAVKNGTAGADFAESLKEEYGFEVVVLEDSPTMYQEVIVGNSDACVEDTPIMAASIKEGGLALQIPAGMESEGAPYGFAVMNEENQTLIDMFNAGLKNIRDNGTYDAILETYLK